MNIDIIEKLAKNMPPYLKEYWKSHYRKVDQEDMDEALSQYASNRKRLTRLHVFMWVTVIIFAIVAVLLEKKIFFHAGLSVFSWIMITIPFLGCLLWNLVLAQRIEVENNKIRKKLDFCAEIIHELVPFTSMNIRIEDHDLSKKSIRETLLYLVKVKIETEDVFNTACKADAKNIDLIVETGQRLKKLRSLVERAFVRVGDLEFQNCSGDEITQEAKKSVRKYE